MSISESIKNFFQRLVKAVAVVADRKEFMRLVQDNLKQFSDVINKDWSYSTDVERDEAVANIKKRVTDELIPAAGMLTLAGAPGILVYTPCQVVGGLAIAKIRCGTIPDRNAMVFVVLGLLFWGKVGQITFTSIADVFSELIPLPIISAAVIPYVQRWTIVALDRVDNHFRKSSNPVRDAEVVVNGPQLLPETALLLESNQEVVKLAQIIRRGGKILYDAQQKVVDELFAGDSGSSILDLNNTHLFRGVAGSGKTVIMATLVPRIIEAYQDEHGHEPRILVYHYNNYIHTLLRNEILGALKAARPASANTEAILNRTVEIHTIGTLNQELKRLGRVSQELNRGRGLDGESNADRARSILARLKEGSSLYDVVLIDEGQDISQEEFTLVRKLASPLTTSESLSMYVFYDDMQNIFDNESTVISRLQGISYKEHFLPNCVRTTKKLMDFTINTCISPSLDLSTRTELAESVRLGSMERQGLVTIERSGRDEWINCRFCAFPGDVLPDVRQVSSNRECAELICNELDNLRTDPETVDFGGSVLIICLSKSQVNTLYAALTGRFGSDSVRKQSGDSSEISSSHKRDHLAVEPGAINVATLYDAKGYDADVVFVVNPDGIKVVSEIQQRMNFYVAATRAKQFLAIYSSIPEREAPIMGDAQRTIARMSMEVNAGRS